MKCNGSSQRARPSVPSGVCCELITAERGLRVVTAPAHTATERHSPLGLPPRDRDRDPAPKQPMTITRTQPVPSTPASTLAHCICIVSILICIPVSAYANMFGAAANPYDEVIGELYATQLL